MHPSVTRGGIIRSRAIEWWRHHQVACDFGDLDPVEVCKIDQLSSIATDMLIEFKPKGSDLGILEN